METIYTKSLNTHLQVISNLLNSPECSQAIDKLGKFAVETLHKGNKILLCGNGGSAADCQHIAAELVGRFGRNRPSLGAIALTVDSSALTAIANDYDFNMVFSRQVEGLGKSGDLLIGISTSGNSRNVIAAMEKAREIGLKTAGLTGSAEKSQIRDISDVCICIPSTSTPRIQEAHILIGHILCEYIEKELFGAPTTAFDRL